MDLNAYDFYVAVAPMAMLSGMVAPVAQAIMSQLVDSDEQGNKAIMRLNPKFTCGRKSAFSIGPVSCKRSPLS